MRSASQLIEQQAELGVVAHVADDDQRLARAHDVAVAHENLANDAAFLVLHGLAIQLHLELARRDDRAGERRGADPHARASRAVTASGINACRSWRRSSLRACGSAAPSDSNEANVHSTCCRVPACSCECLGVLGGREGNDAIRRRADAGAPAPRRSARTSRARRSCSTSSLSSAAVSAGLWADHDDGHAARLEVGERASSAASPARSRFAFGSSSTTTRGSPYSARASAMRCRWPPESIAPPSPICVS